MAMKYYNRRLKFSVIISIFTCIMLVILINCVQCVQKKRKLNIMFGNLSIFKDKHLKLAGYLDLTVIYQ